MESLFSLHQRFTLCKLSKKVDPLFFNSSSFFPQIFGITLFLSADIPWNRLGASLMFSRMAAFEFILLNFAEIQGDGEKQAISQRNCSHFHGGCEDKTTI